MNFENFTRLGFLGKWSNWKRKISIFAEKILDRADNAKLSFIILRAYLIAI